MDAVQVILIMSVPFLGLALLFALLNRWGRTHDLMKRSDFKFWTPKSRR